MGKRKRLVEEWQDFLRSRGLDEADLEASGRDRFDAVWEEFQRTLPGKLDEYLNEPLYTVEEWADVLRRERLDNLESSLCHFLDEHDGPQEVNVFVEGLPPDPGNWVPAGVTDQVATVSVRLSLCRRNGGPVLEENDEKGKPTEEGRRLLAATMDLLRRVLPFAVVDLESPRWAWEYRLSVSVRRVRP